MYLSYTKYKPLINWFKLGRVQFKKKEVLLCSQTFLKTTHLMDNPLGVKHGVRSPYKGNNMTSHTGVLHHCAAAEGATISAFRFIRKSELCCHVWVCRNYWNNLTWINNSTRIPCFIHIVAKRARSKHFAGKMVSTLCHDSREIPVVTWNRWRRCQHWTPNKRIRNGYCYWLSSCRVSFT